MVDFLYSYCKKQDLIFTKQEHHENLGILSNSSSLIPITLSVPDCLEQDLYGGTFD
jgi:hypothetical protein